MAESSCMYIHIYIHACTHTCVCGVGCKGIRDGGELVDKLKEGELIARIRQERAHVRGHVVQDLSCVCVCVCMYMYGR